MTSQDFSEYSTEITLEFLYKRQMPTINFHVDAPNGFQRSERDRDASFSQLSPLPLVLQYTSMSPTWSLSFNSFLFLIDQFYKLQAIYCSKCLRERHLLTQQIYHNIPFLLAPIAIPQSWIPGFDLYCLLLILLYLLQSCDPSLPIGPKSHCTSYQNKSLKDTAV